VLSEGAPSLSQIESEGRSQFAKGVVASKVKPSPEYAEHLLVINVPSES
jgi:hypothetical protein